MEVEKLGEGYSRENYEQLPLDVPSGKLIEWLLERRLIPIKWHKELAAVQAQISQLRTALPDAPELQQVLAEAKDQIDYSIAEKFIEYLIKTEGDLTLFRQYKSTRLHSWLQIQKALQKDGLYLAETASAIQKLVLYDIPANKKQIQQYQQQANECDKRDYDFEASATALRAKFVSQCNEMKIKGENVRHELEQVANDLPHLFDEIALDIQAADFEEILAFFRAFMTFLNPESQQTVLPMLSFLHTNGHTTRHYYLTGQEPKYRPKDSGVIEVVKELSVPTEVSEGIDWNVEVTSAGASVVESEQQNANDAEIDWDVSVLPADHGISIEPEPIPNEAANRDHTQGILENIDLRNLFLDELHELQAFFTQRLAEMKGKTDVVSTNMFQMAPEILQKQTVESIQRYAKTVDRCISKLTNSRVRHLILVKASPKYLDRLTTAMTQTLTYADRADQRRQGVQAKREAIIAQQQVLHENTKALLSETRGLQKRMEDWLSQSLQRTVRIMG